MQSPWWSRSSAELRAQARAFGERSEDLDVNFARHSRPVLVSGILQCCLSAPEEPGREEMDVWSWTLGQRTQGLLAVAAASGVTRLAAVHECDHCGEQLELPVDLAGFAREERLTRLDPIAHAQRTFGVALPTGRHQQHWLRAGATTDRAMARDLVCEIDGAAPTTDWELDDDGIEAIAALLEQHDPLTGLELRCDCPECAASLSMQFDLEALLIEQFRARQWHMLEQIHRLANAYHWSEAAITALPAWRRRHYLALLGVAGDA